MTAFAACLLKNLARARVLMGFDYTNAEVEVTATRRDSPPQFVAIHHTLRVTTTESNRRIELMHRNLAKFGTIYNTLAAACDVSGEVVRVSPSRVGDHRMASRRQSADHPRRPTTPRLSVTRGLR